MSQPPRGSHHGTKRSVPRDQHGPARKDQLDGERNERGRRKRRDDVHEPIPHHERGLVARYEKGLRHGIEEPARECEIDVRKDPENQAGDEFASKVQNWSLKWLEDRLPSLP